MAQKDPYYVARGRVAATSPNGIHPDAKKHHTAQQEFALAKIARFIQRALADAPPHQGAEAAPVEAAHRRGW